MSRGYKDPLYRDVADLVNTTTGRRAVSASRLQKLVMEAKYVRKTQGTMGLMNYAQRLPYQFLSTNEIEMLRTSPRYREFSYRVIDLFVREGVISQFEAMMLRRAV
ncbi:hypothetical protein [Thermoactinomyces sp. DSM 45892]|uniref:hypothetical protein n=1 Tax=Thermoactinomyces sp. DSM 45892 TaxID=1882753 RepID=UPI0008960072|nr:hypothetical protein [Thermoactinomyces sp. DSM 45892]SDX99256.1 hypothetical protein SAMN05444416_101191 [Thermoactinomyces sp. DSM 45892]